MNRPPAGPGRPRPLGFLHLLTPESRSAAQPQVPLPGDRANVRGAGPPLTYGPMMAGYGGPLDAYGRCRHMADPIKVFWQPH